MPAGPHLRSVREIRKVLEDIPDAIRYEDPLTERAGSGDNPATEVWISDPDRDQYQVDVPGLDTSVDPETDSDEEPNDEPAVIFEVPPEMTDADIRNVLGEDRLHAIERLYQLRGTDALGWYTTFHQKRVQHGVSIPIEGVLALVVHAFAGLDLPLDRKCELAFHAILRHELFHFAADCMTANWELATGVAVYWKAHDRYRNPQGYVDLEEALANAYILRGFKHPTRLLANTGGAYQLLKCFCERQPAGYREGWKYAKTRGSYFEGCYELSEMYQHASLAPWHSPEALDALIFYPDIVRIDWTRCPIFVLDEHDLQRTLGIGVSYFDAVEIFEETDSFKRSYSKLDRKLQKIWGTRKNDLARSTALKSLDFKQWKKDGRDVYSVRLDGNHRAHLRYDRDRTVWYAEQIGDHKAMGHG